MRKTFGWAVLCVALHAVLCSCSIMAPRDLTIGEGGYFETRGLNVLVFNNWYDSLFSDAKISGVEVIHHGERTVTNGDVRLSPTPGQWEPVGRFIERRVDENARMIEADLSYPDYDFSYTIRVDSSRNGVTIRVLTNKPLPKQLVGRAGFNLEFLPSAYFGHSFMADDATGLLPRYPSGDMVRRKDGPRSDGAMAEPLPMAEARRLVLAPEDKTRRIALTSTDVPIRLYDGRNQAQNGWFVARSLIPAKKKGTVIKWTLEAGIELGWKRPPVISYSQVGYTPDRSKVAIIELDPNDHPQPSARLLRVEADGSRTEIQKGQVTPLGRFLRYHYAKFDFSEVTKPGLYVIISGGQETAPFRIAADVYDSAWHPTMDIFFPVQMDHMEVHEAYRVWHGASHLDDALQAPVDHEHHDLYRQGPTTDTAFEPLQHIPGLNVGGWYDAGDYDIRTQSQYGTIRSLVATWEAFKPKRDQTQVDQLRRRVDLHTPDGEPDILQQIEHGTLQLVAQHQAVGHALHGIVEPDLSQYTHLGDAVTKTDNLVYDSALGPDEIADGRSGRKDDRWAFTTKASAVNYGSAAGLAAAARVLKGYNDELAEQALDIAVRVWEVEEGQVPNRFRHGNTTGGPLEAERFVAAAELLLSTEDEYYIGEVDRHWPVACEHFGRVVESAVAVLSKMPASFREQLRQDAECFLDELKQTGSENPFGVRITRGGWAGAGTVVNEALARYALYQVFPKRVDPESIFTGLDFVLGRHPGHNLSLVSAVGARSKEVAYGYNRADFSFIAGGVVPGVLIIKPDFPENKEDWPFLWGENEYVIPLAARYVQLVHAARVLTGESVVGP